MFCWGAPPRRRKMLRLRARGGSFTPLRGYTPSAPCGGTFSCAHPQCVPQGHLLRGAHWGALKGKANEDVSFDDISLVNG